MFIEAKQFISEGAGKKQQSLQHVRMIEWCYARHNNQTEGSHHEGMDE